MDYYVQFETQKNKIYGGNTMNNITDTNILRDDFDKLLNDSNFLDLGDEDSLPYIADNIEVFLSKYIEFCQKIATGRREKVKQIMNIQGVSSRNCKKTIVEKIQQMMDECGRELSDEEKTILEWNKKPNSSDSFSSVPTEDAVKKWLSDTGARNPNRMYLYKIAFALGLKVYYPNEIKDDTSDEYKISSEEYKTSVNYLFNKVYNQRYCTRTYYELIFIFCLKNGKNYLTAMKMIAQYLKIPGTDSIKLDDQKNNTLYIVQQGQSQDENEFVSFLVQITPLLNDKYSSVFSQIEDIIEYFSAEDVMQEFYEQYTLTTRMNDILIAYDQQYIGNDLLYKSYMNLGEKVVINNTIKKYMKFFDNRMRISSSLYEHRITSDDKTEFFPELKKSGISENLYDYLIRSASESISARFGSGSQEYFSDIVKEVIITEDDIYTPKIIKRSENSNGEYEWKVRQNTNLSHDLIYKDLRNALITAHFFCYWSETDAELSYDGYKKEINEILSDSFYQELSVKNSFDCFFMLCAKTMEPIDSYYSVIKYIFSIYQNYQNGFTLSEAAQEFRDYQEYSPENKYNIEMSYKKEKSHPVINSKWIHTIDQTENQEKILNIIKQYAQKRDNK